MPAPSQTILPPSKALLLLEGRTFHELGAFLASLPLLSMARRGDGHPVLILPGLVASDGSTRPLRTFLSHQGYALSGWGQGRNYGLRDGIVRVNSKLPPSARGWARAVLFLLTNCRRARPDSTPKIAYTYLP